MAEDSLGAAGVAVLPMPSPAWGEYREGEEMKLKTRVFELCKGKYENLHQLSQAMGIAPSQVYRVWHGERKTIGEKFILGAVRAFPGYSLNDLFYIERD